MSTEPSHKIVIVGGGTAGWMAALIMARNWLARGVEITLLESPDVGIIGVGEGSTPTLKKFFKDLDIPESEWMPECNATYKCGINFDKWSTKPGFENYFHPFASSVDQHTLPLFMQHAQARQQGINLDAHPNRFFLAAHLAAHNLAPKHSQQENFPILYGYHFDAALLGQFLRKKAIAMGVFYRSCHVQAVTLNEQGDISAVTTKEGDTIGANFFVDCTGFNSLLLQQHLKVDFNSFGNNLFNDAAVAMPSSITEKIPSQTISTALNNGWAWKIPLTNRFGNGYVYSSAFCSANDAELELRTHLGLLDADIPVRHLKMKVGQVQQHWAKNCLAVGLSQGFIEPLEATALYLVQQTAEIFVEAYEKGNFSSGYRAAFNKRISDYFEGTRDYIVTHYKTSSRTDTAYWRANTEDQTAVSDKMKILYNAWMTGKNIAEEIKHLGLEQYYPAPSWYCILAGMGIFAPIEKLRAPRAEELQYDLRKVDNYLSTTAQHFFDHRAYLAQQKTTRNA